MSANLEKNRLAGSLGEKMKIDSAERLARKRFIDFNNADVALLKQLGPLVRAHADRIVDGFYDNIQRQTKESCAFMQPSQYLFKVY